ncbi:MAG: MFS transporter [Erysipelotrichaceae bacterium]
MNIKHHIAKFSFVYFIAYIFLAAVSTQFVPYLSALGYNAAQRGFLLSFASICAILIQLYMGYLSDRHQQVKRFFLISLLICGLAAMCFFQYETAMFVMHCILIGLCGGIGNTSFTTLDNWLYSNGETLRINFSFIRSFGSLGWSVGSIILSQLISLFGYRTFGLAILGFTLFLMACVSWCDQSHTLERQAKVSLKKQDIVSLLQNKTYVMAVCCFFFLTMAITAHNSATVDKLLELEATTAQIGLKWALQGIVEIPLFLAGVWLFRNFSTYKLLTLSALAIFVQYVLFATCSSVEAMLWICVVQFIHGPLFMVAARNIVYEQSPTKLKNLGLLLAVSLYYSIPGIIFPMIGGMMTNQYGVNMTLAFAALCGLIGFILSLYLLVHHDSKNT